MQRPTVYVTQCFPTKTGDKAGASTITVPIPHHTGGLGQCDYAKPRDQGCVYEKGRNQIYLKITWLLMQKTPTDVQKVTESNKLSKFAEHEANVQKTIVFQYTSIEKL